MISFHRARIWLITVVACFFAATPGAAMAVSYGFSDSPSVCTAWGTSACNAWGYGFASYFSSKAAPGRQSAFAILRANLPLRYVRLSVPYDAVYDADPASGQCRSSYDYISHPSSLSEGGGPGSAWYRLAQELKDAQSIGLTPVVALSNATADGQQQDGNPSTPDMTAASSSGPDSVPTVAGEDYSCGVRGVTYLTHAQGLTVGEWEAWNEPDGSPAYNGALNNVCGSLPNSCAGIYDQGTGLCGSTTYVQCGPLEAAHMYAALVNALTQLNAQYGWALPPTAAGALSWPSLGYFNAYARQLSTVIGRWPPYWSYHDYADVTNGQYAQSLAFTKDLYNTYANAGQPQPSAWITESGVVLTDTDTSYNGQAIACANGEGDDALTLGACVDGSPSAQQAGATTFLNLPTNGAYAAGQITELFWFQLQPANASTGWDSGLLAPPKAASGSWSQVAPDGIFGSVTASTGLRASYCVLARLPAGDCSPSHVAGSDWSIQPRTVTASLTAGQTTATVLSGDQSSLANGDFVTGDGISSATVITSGAGTSTWTLSHPAAATKTEHLTASG